MTRNDSAVQNKSYKYSYDDAGNILTKKEYDYTTGTLGTATDTITYEYSDSDWGDLLVNYDGQEITYDEIGNMLTFGDKIFTWQGRSLKKITEGDNTSSYLYNSDGIRTKKTVNGTETEYFLNGNQIIAQKTGDDVIWFIYDSEGNRVGLNRNGLAYYYLYNLQGDVVGIVRASTGKVVATYEYDAWGNCTVSNADGFTVGNANPFRYRGYYWDEESGLYYLNSRYYDPEIGRFISADNIDILTIAPTEYNDKNMYAYCNNNPVSMVDDCGNVPLMVAGVLVGGGLNVVSQIIVNIASNNDNILDGIAIAFVGGAVTGLISTIPVAGHAVEPFIGVIAEAAGAATESVITEIVTYKAENKEISMSNIWKSSQKVVKEVALNTAVNYAAGGYANAVVRPPDITVRPKDLTEAFTSKPTVKLWASNTVQTGITTSAKVNASIYGGGCSR